MNNIFVSVFLIVALYFGRSNESLCNKNTVAFHNHLVSSRSILKVHCKSETDDLGDHFLKSESPTYKFSFHDNIVGTTRFICNLWKGANMEYHQSIRAYVEDQFVIRCGTLYSWDIRDDGIYLSIDDKPEELKYQWIKD